MVHNLQRTTAKQPLEAGKTSLKYPDEQHICVLRYSTDDVEAASIAEGIAKIDRAQWGEVAVLARTRYMLEKLQSALTQKQVNAVISQRRDDFRSPQFLWLAAVLRQGLRPLDRRALEILTGAFHRWFGTDARVDLIVTATELTEREREIIARVGPRMREMGLVFVGLDVIDGNLTEINVTSPTGIRAVERLGGPDVAGMFWDAVEAKLG